MNASRPVALSLTALLALSLASACTRTIETERFQIHHGLHQTERAQNLSTGADDLAQAVNDALGTQPREDKIQVLTFNREAAGTRIKNTFFLDFERQSDLEARGTLVHLTTRDAASRASKGASTRLGRYLQGFVSGLATDQEADLIDPTFGQSAEIMGAIHRARGNADIDLALDRQLAEETLRRFDGETLGLTLIRAIEDVGGEGATGRVLQAFGDLQVQPGEDARIVWTRALAAADLEFDAVETAYNHRLDQGSARYQAMIAQFPQLTSHLIDQNGEVQIARTEAKASEANLTSEHIEIRGATFTVSCRFRTSKISIIETRAQDGKCPIPAEIQTTPDAQIQLSLSTPAPLVIVGSWGPVR